MQAAASVISRPRDAVAFDAASRHATPGTNSVRKPATRGSHVAQSRYSFDGAAPASASRMTRDQYQTLNAHTTFQTTNHV